jgi:hypothetical protein
MAPGKTLWRAALLMPLSIALVLALLAQGCGGEQGGNVQQSEAASQAAAAAMKVTAVVLGKGMGADMQVSTPATIFAPADTIHIAISTTGAMMDATLMLMFRRLGDTATLMHENRTISPAGSATSTFRVARPELFVPGKYSLDTFLNGGLADIKEFEIRK